MTATGLIPCPACGKLVDATKTGKPRTHAPSVRHPEALTANGRCRREVSS